MIFKIYIFIHKIRVGILKVIERKSTEIYAIKIKTFLEDNLSIKEGLRGHLKGIPKLEKGQTSKTTLRIDRVALSVARTIKDSDKEYIWKPALTHDETKNTIFGLEYLVTNPKYEDGITIVTEVSSGKNVYSSLNPDVMQDFLYNQAYKMGNYDSDPALYLIYQYEHNARKAFLSAEQEKDPLEKKYFNSRAFIYSNCSQDLRKAYSICNEEDDR